MTEQLPPGPRGRLFRGNHPDYEADRLGFLLRCHEDYGDIWSFDDSTVVLGAPDTVHEILGKTNTDYLAEVNFFAGGFADGGFVDGGDAEGAARLADVWMTARRKVSRGFHRKVATAHAGRLIGMLDERLEQTAGLPVDVPPLMADISGRMVADFCFGGEGTELVETVESLVAAGTSIVSAARLLPRWMPVARHRRFVSARRKLKAQFGEIVEHRRAQPAPDSPRDLLDVLLAARELNPHQIQEMLRVTLLASHGVPGAALAWCVRELSFRPDIRLRIEAEAEVWNTRDAPPELSELPYTEAFVKEILRAYPPTWLLGRTARRQVRIGEWSLPPGHEIMFSPYLIHRDPRWWNEPGKIDPQRWLGEKVPHTPHAYFPFGAGPRVCLGAHLGMMQLTLVTSWLVRHYRIDVEEPGTVPASGSALLSPQALRASFVVRAGSATSAFDPSPH